MTRTSVLFVFIAVLTAACTPRQEWAYPWPPAPAAKAETRPMGPPITEAEARHLLRRTGFGTATTAETAAVAGLDYEAAVDKLLDEIHQIPTNPPPDWAGKVPEPRRVYRALPDGERRDYIDMWRERGRDLKVWWLGEMIATPSPLTERLTLFWHGHFTSSLRKVRFGNYLYDQNVLFRREAAGNFARLLRQVSKGPAMLVYLDNQDNKADHPNENFARELLELFTLGEGQGYTERDIRETARALTGWRVNPNTHRFDFRAKVHDPGTKTLLGETGNFDGDSVIDIVLRQRRTATYITERLWKAFVGGDPDPTEIERLADIFRRSGYEIRPLLKSLFMSPAFRNPKNHGILVKSPVDIAVGTYRLLSLPAEDDRRMSNALRRMGQDMLDPPNVKGWPGGTAWINASTLTMRQQFLRRAFRVAREMGRNSMNGMASDGTPMMTNKSAPSGRPLYVSLRAKGADALDLDRMLLPVAAVGTPGPNEQPDVRLQSLLLDPAFQLK